MPSSKCSLTYGKEVNLFRDVANALPDAVDDIIGEVMIIEAAPLAIQLCPKRTRRLSKTIRVQRVRKLLWKLIAGQQEVEGIFVDYEIWVEGGTHNSPAQPFMAPAMQAAKKSLLQKFRSLETYIKRRMR